MGKHIKDFEGLQFGQRLCLGESEKRGRHWYEKCRCLHCGVERFVVRSSLYRGKSTYCGRLIKHGMHGTRIYTIWQNMLRRCMNPNDRGYKRYGGRGIKYDEKWNKFEGFYEDMGESYSVHVSKFGEKQTTLDRIDPNLNYCKENCRWATWDEQGKNSSHCCSIEYNGKKYRTIRELSKDVGIDENTMRGRLAKGIPLEQAIGTPTIRERGRDKLGRFIKAFI